MESDDRRVERAETYKLLATLLLDEPALEAVEHFQEVFQLDLQEPIEDIAADFSTLFYNPKSHLIPYESAYARISDSPVVPDDVASGVYNAYLREGLILEDENVIPDHIAAELFFISYLIEAGKKEPLREFLRDHAVQWVPQFCDDLYESAGTEFYREVAAVTKDYVLSEYEELSYEPE